MNSNVVMAVLCTYTAYSYQVSDFSDTLCTMYCFLASDRKNVGSAAQYSSCFVPRLHLTLELSFLFS